MNSGVVVDHLCVELRKFRCDPNVDSVEISIQVYLNTTPHEIRRLEDLHEGQIAIYLRHGVLLEPHITLPKTVQFCRILSPFYNSCISRPIGLLAFNNAKTTYGEAIWVGRRIAESLEKI